ncbi:MAG TPA: CBS domain-containing protein [Actinophytocola sp.]|uniref:CBS domain-containing protein n=1 Tax=Actinophytocola sp. TaxID=1872138 RepID=UPI002DBD709E|nr:CBS domain-containing protein [Actinophytocola sp.]HEU5471905.1 CBS domain-containing protein [Actinophytocola sp.]
MQHRKIGNVMTTDVATVTESTPFKDIVQLLDRRRISAVPVLDTTGRVIGVVSQADLLPTQQAQQPTESRWPWHRRRRTRAHGTTAGQLMSTPAITIAPDATIIDAAKLLDHHTIKRLPVVNADGQLVGIVSRRDLLGVFLRTDNDIAQEIAREVFQRNLDTVVNPATVTIEVHDGVVSLHGQLQRRSQIPIAEALTHRVDGVVTVHSNLTYEHDDTHLHVPDSMVVDITHEH